LREGGAAVQNAVVAILDIGGVSVAGPQNSSI
jgi:hypothetical protein